MATFIERDILSPPYNGFIFTKLNYNNLPRLLYSLQTHCLSHLQLSSYDKHGENNIKTRDVVTLVETKGICQISKGDIFLSILNGFDVKI